MLVWSIADPLGSCVHWSAACHRLERDFQGAAAGGGLAARHPLLRAILEAAEDLHLVAHLADILVPWRQRWCLMAWPAWPGVAIEHIYLVGGLEHLFIFPYIGNNHPNWLSYFSEGWPNHQLAIGRVLTHLGTWASLRQDAVAPWAPAAKTSGLLSSIGLLLQSENSLKITNNWFIHRKTIGKP